MDALTARSGRAQYECGKVCLSLLNTWAGRNSEVWDSTSSTILQVRLLGQLHWGSGAVFQMAVGLELLEVPT